MISSHTEGTTSSSNPDQDVEMAQSEDQKQPGQLIVQWSTMVFQDSAYVKELLIAARNDAYEVRKEAIWAFHKATEECSPAQTAKLLDNGVFDGLLDLLYEEQDPRLLVVILESIERCVRWGAQWLVQNERGLNKFVVELEKRGGMKKIKPFRDHWDKEVSKRGFCLCDAFLVECERPEDYKEERN